MTKSVFAYFKYLEDFKARLDNHGIKMSKEEIVDVAVTVMWDSEFFIEQKMATWESWTASSK